MGSYIARQFDDIKTDAIQNDRTYLLKKILELTNDQQYTIGYFDRNTIFAGLGVVFSCVSVSFLTVLASI